MAEREKAIDLLQKAIDLLNESVGILRQPASIASDGHQPLPVGTLVDMHGEVGRVMGYEAIVQLGPSRQYTPTAGFTNVSSDQLVQKDE